MCKTCVGLHHMWYVNETKEKENTSNAPISVILKNMGKVKKDLYSYHGLTLPSIIPTEYNSSYEIITTPRNVNNYFSCMSKDEELSKEIEKLIVETNNQAREAENMAAEDYDVLQMEDRQDMDEDSDEDNISEVVEVIVGNDDEGEDDNNGG